MGGEREQQEGLNDIRERLRNVGGKDEVSLTDGADGH